VKITTNLRFLIVQETHLDLGGSPLTNQQNICQKYNDRVAFKVLVGKLEGKSAIGRPRRKGEDNIEMYLQEIGR